MTTINNLSIEWQDESWVVLTPDGQVLGRFSDKLEAEKYAQSNTDFLDVSQQKKKNSELSLVELIENDHTDAEYEYIMPSDEVEDEQHQRPPVMILHNIKQITLLGCGFIILVVTSICYLIFSWIFGQDYSGVSEAISNSSDNLNILGLAVLGLIVVMIVSSLRDSMEEGCLSGCASIFFLIIGITLCNSCGILEQFFNWVF